MTDCINMVYTEKLNWYVVIDGIGVVYAENDIE